MMVNEIAKLENPLMRAVELLGVAHLVEVFGVLVQFFSDRR